ncbi:unnamed protein product [Symbiodinium sp. CCMP2456]|nr:unnamed protein product [Symbiodinium sp. CCMP2456]
MFAWWYSPASADAVSWWPWSPLQWCCQVDADRSSEMEISPSEGDHCASTTKNSARPVQLPRAADDQQVEGSEEESPAKRFAEYEGAANGVFHELVPEFALLLSVQEFAQLRATCQQVPSKAFLHLLHLPDRRQELIGKVKKTRSVEQWSEIASRFSERVWVPVTRTESCQPPSMFQLCGYCCPLPGTDHDHVTVDRILFVDRQHRKPTTYNAGQR